MQLRTVWDVHAPLRVQAVCRVCDFAEEEKILQPGVSEEGLGPTPHLLRMVRGVMSQRSESCKVKENCRSAGSYLRKAVSLIFLLEPC
mmetsp:Transcript_15175/g.51180  ORF Transcript_15175/g.51180 Transcript_15175/m.51180 type:complete len:88 (+) Transcript_15175:877-1140(+)